MSSGGWTRAASASVVRRLTPWAVVGVIGALLIGVLPSAQAQSGGSASDAIPIGTDGRFSGMTGPASALWYKFNYIGGGQQATVTLNFEPPDSTRLDIFIFTGDPANPSQASNPSSLSGNTRTIQYSDQGAARVVFLKVENDHPDRTVSFVGAITPTATVATPTPTSAANPVTPQTTPTAGPVAPNAASAITIVDANGQFSGTLAPGQPVWYRFYYGNPGANTTVTVSVAPTADNADLNVYTGTDPANLVQQGGNQQRSGNTLTRTVSNLTTAQMVYFSIGNNGGGPLAYGGNVAPFFAPPATATPTSAVTATTTATAVVATATAQPAPTVAHDQQYYAVTGYRVDDRFLNFFQSRGAVDTFGYPISRTFTFLGCPVQMFQRLIMQQCADQVQLINMLDPDIFPYTRVNGSVFPGPDDQLKAQTPPVSSPDYSASIVPFILNNTPDTFMGLPVNFGQTWQSRGGLEVLGAVISKPQADPSNASFVYQRFQRVILHYRQGIGTEPLLLADYLKQIVLGPNAPSLPSDLQQQASGSRFYAQYCRGGTRWLCRPADLGGTDLTFAFEQG